MELWNLLFHLPLLFCAAVENDIDECAQGIHECQQVCINTDGGYQCSCEAGYRLLGPYNCIDINECMEGGDRCAQFCVNTQGSYYCSCRSGFQLAHDGTSCQDIDECAVDTDNCEHICINTLGSYRCACKSGYRLKDFFACTNIDECQEGGHCPPQYVCYDTEGSFVCRRDILKI